MTEIFDFFFEQMANENTHQHLFLFTVVCYLFNLTLWLNNDDDEDDNNHYHQ